MKPRRLQLAREEVNDEERDLEMAYSVAYQHTDGNRNYDGSDLVYGVKKRVGHSNEVLHFIVPMRTKNKRTPFVDVRLRING